MEESVSIRRQMQNRKSLQDTLRAIVAAGGTINQERRLGIRSCLISAPVPQTERDDTENLRARTLFYSVKLFLLLPRILVFRQHG